MMGIELEPISLERMEDMERAARRAIEDAPGASFMRGAISVDGYSVLSILQELKAARAAR